MKQFFYMGPNRQNVSGVSWKLWKIERKRNVLTVWFGPARLVKRRPVAASSLQKRKWRFGSESRAKLAEQRRIDAKLDKGYKRMPRRTAS
jgi:hypothetical protein